MVLEANFLQLISDSGLLPVKNPSCRLGQTWDSLYTLIITALDCGKMHHFILKIQDFLGDHAPGQTPYSITNIGHRMPTAMLSLSSLWHTKKSQTRDPPHGVFRILGPPLLVLVVVLVVDYGLEL